MNLMSRRCKKKKKSKSKSFWIQATALAFVAILTISVKITGAASKLQRRPAIAGHPRHSVQFPEAPWPKITMRELRPYSGKGHLSWRDVYHSVHQGKARQQQHVNTKSRDHKIEKRSLQDEESDSDLQGGSDVSENELDQGMDELRLTLHDHHPYRRRGTELKDNQEPYVFYVERHDHHPARTKFEQQKDSDSSDYLNYQGLGNNENFMDHSLNSKTIERLPSLQNKEENYPWQNSIIGKVESPDYKDTRWFEDPSQDVKPYDAGVEAESGNVELSPNLRNELKGDMIEYGVANQRKDNFAGENFRESNLRSLSSGGLRRRNKWLNYHMKKLGLPRWRANRRLWRKKTTPDEWIPDLYHQLYDAKVEKTVEDDRNVQLVLLGQRTEIICVPKDKGVQPKNLMVTWHNGRGAAIISTGRHKITNEGSMEIQRVKLYDSGLHVCSVDSEEKQYRHVLAVYLPKVPGYNLRWKYRIETCRESDLSFLRNAFRATLLKYVCSENICAVLDVRVNCQFTALDEARVLEVAALVGGSLAGISKCPRLRCQRWKLRRSASMGSIRLRMFAHRDLRVHLPASGSQGMVDSRETQRLWAIGPRSFTGIAILSCPAGYGEGKKGKCLPCEPGRYSKAGTLHCLQCREGFYQPEYAAQSCIKCSSGTSRPGSKRKAACGLKFRKRIQRKELIITIPLTVIIIFIIGALGCVGLSVNLQSGATETERNPVTPDGRLPFEDISSTPERDDDLR